MKRSSSVPADMERAVKKARPSAPGAAAAVTGGFKCGTCDTQVTDLNTIKCLESINSRECNDCHECTDYCKHESGALEEARCADCVELLEDDGKHAAMFDGEKYCDSCATRKTDRDGEEPDSDSDSDDDDVDKANRTCDACDETMESEGDLIRVNGKGNQFVCADCICGPTCFKCDEILPYEGEYAFVIKGQKYCDSCVLEKRKGNSAEIGSDDQ